MEPGGVDRVAHNGVDAGSEESVFFNGFGDFDFDGKDIDNKAKQNNEYAEDGEKDWKWSVWRKGVSDGEELWGRLVCYIVSCSSKQDHNYSNNNNANNIDRPHTHNW